MKNIEEHIKQLEQKLLHSDTRANPKILDELLADDFEEIGSIGQISSRKDVINWLVNKEKDIRWSLNEFRIKQLSPDLMLAIYRATKNENTGNASKGSIRSSIWKRTDKGWQMIFHQGTKLISK